MKQKLILLTVLLTALSAFSIAPLGPSYYTLTVNSGTGDGSYTNGQQVAIAAGSFMIPEWNFDRWIGGDVQYVNDVTYPNATVTMPATNITVTAAPKDFLNHSFFLMVINGSGGGMWNNGQVVPISANAPARGKAFDRWVWDTQNVADISSSNTIVTMPAYAIALMATYKDASYTLTITSGGGGGSFTNGEQVVITANAPAVGKAFDQWTGDTQYVASVTSLNTTVTMPEQDVSLTATYTDVYYALSVTGGSGDGTYTNGTQVFIIASNAPAGQEFDHWIGDTQYLANLTLANTMVTMPAQDVSLTATYKTVYTLTVNNGTGGGSYTNTQVVDISADAPAVGKAFDQWIGDTQYVDSVTSTNATVTMPAQDVSLSATYKDVHVLTVNNGTGGGVYPDGAQIEIAADAPVTGRVFDRWIGDTQYVASVSSSPTTVTMPTNAVSLTATYTNLPGWYTLTVNNGSAAGGGVYPSGARIMIAANAPADGKTFNRWIGDTQYVASIALSVTTVVYVASAAPTNAIVIMPATNVSVTATYGYYLRIHRGFYSGCYTNGQKVAINFWPFGVILPPGWVFDRWTGDTQFVANATSTTTTVTMPATSVVCVADFRDVQKPVLTVSSPINGERVGGALVKVTGKVTDNDGATDIFIRLNGGDWTTNSVLRNTNGTIAISRTNTQSISKWTANNGFSGTTSWATNDAFTYVAAVNIIGPTTNNGRFGTTFWTNSFTLQIGTTNVLQAYARDATGNISTTSTLTFVYVNAGDLTIQTNGPGTVIRSPIGVPELGLTYTLTAISPKIGSVFTGWTGFVTSTNKVVTFDMTNIVAITANFTDIQKPTVAITAPTALQRILGTNGLFTLRGTAADNHALTNVLVQLNSGSWTDTVTTNGYKNWSRTVTLTNGLNTIRACSLDAAGSRSLTSTVTCVYVPTARLMIQTNGLGTVTRTPAGEPEVGKTYILTATPKTGSVFSSWTGDSVSNPTGRVVSITMTSNKTVTANFIDIQKPTVAITYPTALLRVVTNGAVILRGTATDNSGLVAVMYQLYTGEWTNAVMTNVWKNWTAEFYPVAGLNTARVYSVDLQGYVSATSTVVFTYAPGAVMTVQTNGAGTVTPAYNGKVLEIGKSYTMTAKAKAGNVFTNWTYGVGEPVATNKASITFVMQSNLVLTANFRNLLAESVMADIAVDMPATPQAAIVVDGVSKDWMGVPRSSFSYASVTQEVAAALDGNSIALLLNGCPFENSDNVLVYFKLRLSYGVGDDRHSVDLWTSGSVLYGMVDGQVIAGLEAILLNGVLEVKLPVEQAPSQVTIEEIGCGMDLGTGTLMELFKFAPSPAFSP